MTLPGTPVGALAVENPGSPFAATIKFARRYLAIVLSFSFLINVLMLTAPLYMLQIYDRVLTSRSGYTLLFLTILALAALATLALLDISRSRLLVRLSSHFDKQLSTHVFSRSMLRGLGAQHLRDLDQLRTFMTGPTLLAFFDAPWMPLYLATVYFLHPWLGHVGLVGAVLLFSLAVLNEVLTRRWLVESSSHESAANAFAEASARNADAVMAMGILPGLQARWMQFHRDALGFQGGASDRAAIIAATAKFIRFGLQVSILGVGAYLAINEVISSGAMIAASIIMGRGLAPVEAAIAGWRSGVLARDAYRRLAGLLDAEPEPERMPLPAPSGQVIFDNVYGGPPGANSMTVSGASFSLPAGTSLGVTGPSAAGKSSIAKLMVGIWSPASGYVRLDNAELAHWDPVALGPYIGYLPQDIELFTGSVAENIARFGQVDPQLVVAAAQMAGADGMIRELPDGYDTVIGGSGIRLSGGQQQRIGLARAFYGEPPLVVLDEPTSNLDAGGESAVRSAIAELKAKGSTLVVIAHKPTVIGGVEQLMVVQRGQITHFGPASEVFPQITRRVVRGEGDDPGERSQVKP